MCGIFEGYMRVQEREGEAAFRDFQGMDKNPYKLGSQMHEAWEAGWKREHDKYQLDWSD